MDGHVECTTSCHSRQHGDELSSIIMSPMLTDLEVAAYLALKCGNYSALRNSNGKSLAHVAAAAGRLKLLRLFLHMRDCLNEIDEESNYSPLHISLLYGQVHCAVRLIELGGDQNMLDKEFLTPVDITMKDRPPASHIDFKNNYDLYVWGANTNYNLGCGHNRERTLPEPHDFFQKTKVSVCQVGIEKFHTVFVDCSGGAWGCGLGVRAGLGIESAALEPRRIPLPDTVHVATVSVGENHTLLLSSTGTVFSCGLNANAVLGHSQRPPSLQIPKPVRGLPSIKGICATQFHSVFYSDTQLFTCGVNNGQLGLSEGEFVITPKEVTAIKIKDAKIEMVVASANATVMLNSEGAVYLLNAYRCTRLTPRDWLRRSRALAVVGGHDDVELRVALVTIDNMMYVWRKSTQQFLPCLYSARRQLKLFSLALTATGCIFTTLDGEAFFGFFRSVKSAKAEEVLDVRRIAHVHRGRAVATDPRGRNFAVIQHNPKLSPIRSQYTSQDVTFHSLWNDLGILLDEASEDDGIHDVVFIVGDRSFFAHSFIIFYGNSHTTMKKLMEERNEAGQTERFAFVDLPVGAFEAVLRYIYTMQCSIAPKKRTVEEEENVSAFEAYKQKAGAETSELRFVARRLGVSGLLQLLDGKQYKDVGLARKAGVHDTVLVAQDGLRVRAHKCVLVARLEFFRVMLTHGWRESVETELRVPVTGRVLEVLVEFLYTDKSNELAESTDVDFLSLVLVSADELLCEGLKHCAGLGLERLMTLRNGADLFQLASTCNAGHLMSFAQRFILANLAAFLESRSLEILPDERLEELSIIYKGWLPFMRRLKSCLDPLEVAMVRSLAEAFPVTLPEGMELAQREVKQPKRKRERKTSERQRRVSGDAVEESAPSPLKPVHLITPPPASPSPAMSAPSPSDPSKSTSIVQRRLNVIVENVHAPLPSETLTLLTKKAAQVSLQDFPQIDRPRPEKIPLKSSPVDLPKKFTKLSQRERRKLASVSFTEGDSVSPLKDVTSPPRSAWAPLPPRDTPLSCSPEKGFEMEAIIDAEKAERERLARLRSKPLALTQMEDRALHELEIFYNVAQVADERITVQRLATPAVGAPPPVWPINKWR